MTGIVREIEYKYVGEGKEAQAVRSLDDARKFFAYLADEVVEKFVVLVLNNANLPLAWDTVSMGTTTESIIHPREVFRTVVRVNGVSIITAHNHPSGNFGPSTEDIQLTRRLDECAKILGIRFMDHLIIVRDGAYSFRESGILGG